MINTTDTTHLISKEGQDLLNSQQAISQLVMEGVLSLLEQSCDCDGCKVWRQIARIIKQQNQKR